MATYVTPEQRAKILSAIKDEGMSIVDAAKTFLVTEDTIKKWMRKQSRNGHTHFEQNRDLFHLKKLRFSPVFTGFCAICAGKPFREAVRRF